MTRLGGEASKHITLKRREKSLANGDLSINELLDMLSDLYETPLSVIYKENRHALDYLKQETKQPFAEFYAKWVRYSERGYAAADEEMRVWDLEDRLKEELQKPFVAVGHSKKAMKEPWTITDSKAYLTKLDQSQRLAAERLAQEKAQAFAAQYARAKAQAQRSQSSKKVSILSRSDSGYGSEGDPAYWR